MTITVSQRTEIDGKVIERTASVTPDEFPESSTLAGISVSSTIRILTIALFEAINTEDPR